jgi:hypothetical protein
MSQNIKRMIACGLFLAQGLCAQQQPNQKKKNNSSQAQTQPAQPQRQQAPHQSQQSHSQNQQHHSQPTKQQGSGQSSTSQLDTMMQTFIQDAHKIKSQKPSSEKSTGSQKSSSSEKSSPETEKAYQSYKKLYDYMKKNHVTTVSKSQNDQMKPALKKLFDNKRVKNMAWKVKTSKSSSSQGSSSKQQ